MNKGTLGYIKKMYRASCQYKNRLGVCNQLPVRLWIEPTNRCNLKCIMCPGSSAPSGTKYGSMDMALYKKIIDEASEFAIDINLFARGESLLCENIFGMIEYAHSRGLRTRLETNATLLSEEKSEKLIKSGLDFLSFSVDGYTKKTYEKIRVNANFEKTLENILAFLKLKKKLKSKKPFTMIQIIEMPEVKNLSGRAERKGFMTLFKGAPPNAYRFITPHRFSDAISQDVTGVEFAYMKKDDIFKNLFKLKYTPCPYPWYGMSIYYDGTVLPCCLSFFNNYVIGNANTQSLKQIWNAEAMTTLRQKLTQARYREINMCRECDFLYQRTMLGFSTKSFRDIITFLREVFYA